MKRGRRTSSRQRQRAEAQPRAATPTGPGDGEGTPLERGNLLSTPLSGHASASADPASEPELRALLSAAQAAEARFRGLLEAAPDAIVMADQEGHILLVNRQTEALFGYERGELIGQPVETLIPRRFHESHTHHRDGYVRSPRTRPMGQGLELYGQRRDGSEFPVEVSLSAMDVQDSTVVISAVRDITRRKRMAEALQAAEREAERRAYEAEARLNLLQTIIDELPSGIFLVRGDDARLVLANHAALVAWGAHWRRGQAMDDFLAEHDIHVFAADGRLLGPDQLATLRTVRTGEAAPHQQEIIRHPDGTSLPVLFHAVALDPGALGSAFGEGPNSQNATPERMALVVLYDVSALKEAERLKDEFIGIAAHELRNPMAALKGFAQMLTRQADQRTGPPLDDVQREAIDAIDQASSRLVELTDDLLDVTRLQADRLDLRIEPHDLVALARRTARRLQVITDRHTVRVRAGHEYIVVDIDARRIEQVLSNLINNAIKYSPAGGPIDILIRADGTASTAELEVRDQGIGIPADEQAHVFGRFVRADNVRVLGISGTGLGLYLCRELVERHGGSIWFESAEGQGSTFHLSLPLTRATEADVPDTPTSAYAPGPQRDA